MNSKFVYMIIMLPVFSVLSEELYLGVAEQKIEFDKKVNSYIRPMFVKSSDNWMVLDKHSIFEQYGPYNLKWNIAFDGRNLGQIITKDDFSRSQDFYIRNFKRDNFLKFENSKFPKLGNKEARFWGWRGAPKNRPVVVVSKKNFRDHEKWKRFEPSEEFDLLFPLVKEKLKVAYHCNGAPDWNASKIDVAAGNIRFFRSYKNKKNHKLISIGLKESHTKNCDGPVSADHKPMWFYIGQNVKFVGYELDLLDAGDYDADGEIEFLFWHGGYNNDGYTLYESEFRERFDYYWSYH